MSTLGIVSRLVRVNPLAWYAVAYAGTAALQKGLGFVLFLWLARTLPVSDYATFGLLYAMQTGLAAFAAAGVGEAVVGMLGSHGEDAARAKLYAAANAVFLGLAALGVIGAGVIYAGLLWASHGGALEFGCVAVGGVLTAFLTTQSTLSRLQEAHRRAIALGFVGPLAGFLAAFVAFSLSPSTSAFFVGMAAGLAAACVAMRLFCVGHYQISFVRDPLAALRASTVPYVGVVTLAWLAGYGSTFFIETLFAEREVAQFVFAYTLASILQLVATSMNQVWSPRFFKLTRALTLDQVERHGVRFYALQGAVLGICGAAVLLALPWGASVAGGNLAEYRGVGPGLLLLFLGYAAAIPWWHAQNYFYVHGQGASLMRVVLATTAIGVAAWLALMVYAGTAGIYAGFLLQMLIRSAGVWITARLRWGIRFAWQGPAIAAPVLAVGAWLAS